MATHTNSPPHELDAFSAAATVAPESAAALSTGGSHPHAPPPPATDRPSQPASDRILAGWQIGKYKVVSELGEGGMGRVYKALDPELNRPVAIKVLKANTGTDDIVRFRGEAAMIAAVEHPNIVQVYDIATDAGDRPYIVLEYVDGGSLGDRLRDQLPKPREAAELIETLARAVQAAHEKGIIHRDIKPGNVLVTRSGQLKVSDFGLGKRLDDTSGKTRTGDVFGTPGFMAPEQARGDPKGIGPETDVYAIGGILYQMLTGRPPFTGAKVWEVLSQVQYSDPVSPSVLAPRLPKDLCTICLKCLEKPPAKRYRTAAGLADDLRRFLNGETIEAVAVSPWAKAWRQVQRRPREVMVAAVVLLGGVGLGLLALYAWNKTKAEEALADQTRRERAFQEQKDQQAAGERKKLQDQYQASLKAVDDIRAELVVGDLNPDRKRRMIRGLADYYRSLNEARKREGLDRDKVADGLTGLGELYGKTSDKSEAVAAYREAAQVYAEAATDRPEEDRPALLAKAARAHYEAGRYLLLLRKAADAKRELDAAAAEFDRRPDLPADQGEAWHLLGEWHNREREYARAVEYYQKAITVRESIQGRVEGRRRNIARGYGYRGDAYLEMGDLPKADADYWKSIELRKEVVADGVNKDARPEARFQLARGYGNVVGLLVRQRTFTTAAEYLRLAHAELKLAVADRPDNTEFQAEMVTNLNLQADLRLRTPVAAADRAGVDALLDAALRQAADLAEQTGEDDVSVRRGRLVAHAHRARLYAVADPARAAAAAAEAEKYFRPDVADKADCYHYAAVRGVRGDAAEAVTWLRKAVVELKFKERHPRDIRTDPGFAAVAAEKAFDEVVAVLDE